MISMTYDELKADLLAYCHNNNVVGKFGVHKRNGKSLIHFDLTVGGKTYDTGFFPKNPTYDLEKMYELRAKVIYFHRKLVNGVLNKYAAKVAQSVAQAATDVDRSHTDVAAVSTDGWADVPVMV